MLSPSSLGILLVAVSSSSVYVLSSSTGLSSVGSFVFSFASSGIPYGASFKFSLVSSVLFFTSLLDSRPFLNTGGGPTVGPVDTPGGGGFPHLLLVMFFSSGVGLCLCCGIDGGGEVWSCSSSVFVFRVRAALASSSIFVGLAPLIALPGGRVSLALGLVDAPSRFVVVVSSSSFAVSTPADFPIFSTVLWIFVPFPTLV